MAGGQVDATRPEPTGERFEPDLMGGHLIEAEHLSRYAWAAQFVTGRRVLDAACGRGYGAAMMAEAGAESVVGVDIDEAVIAEIGTPAAEGVSFEVGDVLELPFPNDEFDAVVSFETIEHVEDPDRVLDEIRRVLRPGGLAIVSTPNRDVYMPGNPFHMRELTPNELGERLGSRFSSVSLYRQQTWIASGVFDDESFETSDNERIDGCEVRKAVSDSPGQETYTIGVAGDGELPPARSLAALTADVDIRDWSRRMEEADLRVMHAERDNVRTREVEMEMVRGELAELRGRLAEADAELARFLEIEPKLEAAEEALRQHQFVIASASWRLTRPLRKFADWYRGRRS